MTTLLNPLSPIASSASNSSRNVHVFMCKYSLPIPNLHFVSLKKGVSRILASAQMSVATPKQTFIIPDWNCCEGDVKIRVLRVLDAYRHFEGMVEFGHKPDYRQGRKLLSDLCKYSKLEEAVRVMEKMVVCGVMPGINFYSRRLVDFLCDEGEVGHAMQLTEKLEECGYPADTTVFNAIVKGLSMRGTLNLQVLDKLLRKGFVPNAFTYAVLTEAVCREKGVDEATRFLNEIASGGETLDLNCYNVLLTGLCNAGRTDEAIQLLGELPSKGFQPDTASRNILLCSLCTENRWEEATALLDEIGEERNIGTYNILIGSLAQQGKVDDAYGVIKEIKREKMRPDPQSYIMILDLLCKADKFKPAVKCVNQMISHGYRGNQGIYNTIAGLCRHEKVREALILIQRFGSIHPLPKLDFYNSVIQCLCRKGNTQPAFQLLSEMMKDGFVPNSFTYCSLIRGLCAEGMVDEAVEFVSAKEEHGYLSFEVFETMIEKGYKPNEKTYIALVEGIAREDEMELAEEVLKELHQKQVLSPDAVERVCMQFTFKIS